MNYKIFIIPLIIIFLAIGGIVIVKRIQFNQNCSGRLERPATANTVELAVKELDAAIAFAEEKGYTSGYTSVIYRTPDEDIEFWYNNLIASRNELKNLPADASTLEKTNTLMKLRETLTRDNGETGTDVIYPDGLMFYPNNLLWGILRTVSWIAFLFVFLCIKLD